MIRNYTSEQSSAISSLSVEGQAVSVAWHSNPEKVYSFQASEGFARSLAAAMLQPQDVSLGRLIATARRCGDLQQVAA